MTGCHVTNRQFTPYGLFKEPFQLQFRTTQGPKTGPVLNKAPELSEMLLICSQMSPVVLLSDCLSCLALKEGQGL